MIPTPGHPHADPGARPTADRRDGSPTPTSNGQAATPDAALAFRGAEGTVVDRRLGLDRRGPDDMSASALERRRGAGRRRSDFLKAADEGELTKEQFMFLMAIQAFKKANQTMFPTWTDVLEVIRLMGYRKTMPSELKLGNTEDWRENADAPANVRTIEGKSMRRAA
jgi:hypothetical protein